MNRNYQNISNIKGKVILAAAGCGDPELLTIKALKYLQKADVILCDYLASNDIVEQYANPKAEIVYVGKQCKSGLKTPQSVIDDLLVSYAQQGLLVVRLKGGDVSIFSNILDELEALSAHNIAYEIIPGVTSALGAAAYSGMPLTARGYSTGVRFLTYYKSEIIDESRWNDLASTTDTLVFYMSSDKVLDIATLLMKHGSQGDKKLAIVEQASTPNHKVRVYDLQEIIENNGVEKSSSPSLIVVGEVVKLHEKFAWFLPEHQGENYFKNHQYHYNFQIQSII